MTELTRIKKEIDKAESCLHDTVWKVAPSDIDNLISTIFSLLKESIVEEMVDGMGVEE